MPADLPPALSFAPSAVHAPAVAGAALSAADRGWDSYRVQPGDTLYDLAREHGTTVAALAQRNDLGSGRWIQAGEVIELPSKGAPRPVGGNGKPAAPASRTVTVQAGDTLSHIALRYDVSVAAIAKANGLADPRLVHAGQRLTVPGSTGPAAAYRPETVGDRKKGEKVETTFLHYTYGDTVARSAAANRDHLAGTPAPSTDDVRELVVDTARRHGVDPRLMLAVSYTESGWDQRAVSPANAIGVMQVIPTTGDWASGLVGRELNLLDPQDNITAGTVVMRALLRSADSEDEAVAGYYQGLHSVQTSGMYPDTERYVKTIQALRDRL